MDWKQKLSSRKFWALVAGVATSVMVLFGAGEAEIAKVVGVVGAVGSAIAYMFAEAIVDLNRKEK